MPDAESALQPVADPRWRGVRRLLVVRLDNLGDVLMATPAIAALKSGLGRPHVTLLGSAAGCALAPFLDDVDAAIAFAAPWVQGPRDPAARPGRSEAELVARLAAEAFDAAVVFTTCTQSALPAALLCRMAGIPLRLAHARENPYALLSDRLPETDVVADGMRHEVVRQLDLAAAIGCRIADQHLRFRVDAADRAAVRARLIQGGIAAGTGYVVVHPGATAASRRYPAHGFGRAAAAIRASSGAAVVVSGGLADRSLVEEVSAAMGEPVLSLAGELGLGELAALIEGARLLVSNNSGPAHLAAAVATPVVDLYALTNPQHTPWQVPARVLNHPVPCRNCLQSRCPMGHHDCLRRVEPAAVAAAALGLLASLAERGTALAEPPP